MLVRHATLIDVLLTCTFVFCLTRLVADIFSSPGQYHALLRRVVPATAVLFRAPRNQNELEVIWNLLQKSCEYARESTIVHVSDE